MVFLRLKLLWDIDKKGERCYIVINAKEMAEKMVRKERKLGGETGQKNRAVVGKVDCKSLTKKMIPPERDCVKM